MIDFNTMELWFATGSQRLYGEQTLKTVAAHANHIAGELAMAKSRQATEKRWPAPRRFL